MHAIKDKPVVVNGEIVIRPIMVVALTYDHRLLDGREAVTFLGEFFLEIISMDCRSVTSVVEGS
jgi:pyruvate/2-oxoglutarate dehydrogenase complex dihydrolipoamide acyltransferase (E2) component